MALPRILEPEGMDTVDEVRARVAPPGIPADAVRTTSDRHSTLARAKP